MVFAGNGGFPSVGIRQAERCWLGKTKAKLKHAPPILYVSLAGHALARPNHKEPRACPFHVMHPENTMESTNQVVGSSELPQFGIIALDERAIHFVLGWGKCTVWGCSCKAYVSDMQHDGHCTCGHTAADHA